MRSLYFCYYCGSTIEKNDSVYDCPECGVHEVFFTAHMTLFNYAMREFINPVFEEDEAYWWEESMIQETCTAIYLVKFPSNYGFIPRYKISMIGETHNLSNVTIEDMT